MSNFTYSYYQEDFKSATKVNVQQLYDEVNGVNFSMPYLGLEVASEEDTKNVEFQCTVHFSGGFLPFEEKALLDTLINNYIYEQPKTDSICFLKDVKSAGTNGGTLTANTWTVRDLNILEGNVNFCTLNANQFTLTAGSYLINIKAPACDVYAHQIKLLNTSELSEIMGLSSYSTGGVTTYAELNTTLTIDTSQTFEVQHICSKTSSNIGLGRSNGWGEEVYTFVTIQKN